MFGFFIFSVKDFYLKKLNTLLLHPVKFVRFDLLLSIEARPTHNEQGQGTITTSRERQTKTNKNTTTTNKTKQQQRKKNKTTTNKNKTTTKQKQLLRKTQWSQ